MFQENGEGSMMRLLSFMLVTGGIILGMYATFTHQLDLNTITYSLSMITLGLGGKIIQKGQEIKADKPNDSVK